MAISRWLSKHSPTPWRIVAVSVMLTILAQIVMVQIGLTYVNSMNRMIEDNRKSNVSTQFYHNTLLQLGEIDHLLQLLQTPYFSTYFQESLLYRDAHFAAVHRAELSAKLNALHLSPDLVHRIYFIGGDAGQAAWIKDIGQDGFAELPNIRMDLLQKIHMSERFLEDHNRIVKYSSQDLSKFIDSRHLAQDKTVIRELRLFTENLKNRMIISNGNMNGVLILMQLQDDFFRTGLPLLQSEAFSFSVEDTQGNRLWSSDDAPVGQASAKELSPYPYKVTFAPATPIVHYSIFTLWNRLIWLFCATVVVTFGISFFYAKRTLDSFLLLSRKMKEQSRGDRWDSKSISEEWIPKSIIPLTLRQRLLVIFSLAAMLPTLTGGWLYSGLFNQVVQKQMGLMIGEIGTYTGVSIQNRIDSMNHLINQIHASEPLQILLKRTYNSEIPEPMSDVSVNVSIPMLAGLNEAEYFVLFDAGGQAVYSSIFSDNRDLFRLEPGEMRNTDEAYWINGYKDAFNTIKPALIKRFAYRSDRGLSVYYLLLVPRESLFEKLSPLGFALQIKDSFGTQIYPYDRFPPEFGAGAMQWSGRVPESDWRMEVSYSNDRIVYKNREYKYAFLLIIAIVWLLSIVLALTITAFLLKPLRELKRMMALAGEGKFYQATIDKGRNEIAEIVRSYNGMIRQLAEVVHQNMNVMEENANIKIRETELLSTKALAELKMLQAQIKPHFLYNTLEAINMRCMRTGNRDIGMMVTALADLFRYSISNDTEVVTLDNELDHVRNYMAIQQFRTGNLYTFQIDVPKELLAASVVKFILQPIVENCLKHGLEGFDEEGWIGIKIRSEAGCLRIEVSDNGIGMDSVRLTQLNNELEKGTEIHRDHKSDEGGGGIGLSNVSHRLRLYYKDQAVMNVVSEPMRGTRTLIELPLNFG
ncbi:sensor histidine kinase [Cohnella silvisoli]|uniref:histidine kinase n=1 Tax=Cohnella silvisoli TaxID=2873699 RepID=A0ABV1KXG8_9BACL|nr:sensor histidine kinase [Cohnella silvisoli]MCD9023747.1 sensor histidine kinase [Cohnella silvisoli]